MALTDNLAAYWALDAASGTRNDSYSTNHLTDVNTVGTATAKLGAYAAQFVAASSEYLSRADNAALSMGASSYTAAAWVYFDSLGAQRFIVAKHDGLTAAGSEFALYVTGGNAFEFRVYDTGSGTGFASTPGIASTGTWFFVVGWHDDGGNTLNVQVNNGTVYSAAFTTTPNDTTTAFVLGASADGGNLMNGRIDEVGIWRRVLTADERTALYNGGTGFAYPFATVYTQDVAGALTPSGALSATASSPPHTRFFLGATTIDLTDTTKYAVLAEGIAPRPTRKRTIVPISGRDQVRLVYSQAETLELPILLGVTGATHDAFIQNWRDIVEQLRLAREYARDGIGSPVLFTYQWATASEPTVFEVLDGDFPPPPRLTNPVVATGQFYDAQLTLVCQPYGRAASASAPSDQTLTNDSGGWTPVDVGGDAPTPARLRARNRTAGATLAFVRAATRSRGTPANFLFPILPGAPSPSGYTVTGLGAISIAIVVREASGTTLGKVNVGFRHSGTFYPIGTEVGTTGLVTYTIYAPVDPRTGVAWVAADINSYEWGVRVQATGGSNVTVTQFYVSVLTIDRDLTVTTSNLLPIANGAVTDWTTTGAVEGSEWQVVDDPVGTPNDADFIQSFTLNQVSVYDLTTYTLPGGNLGVRLVPTASAEALRITISTNLSDQYGAFRVMVRVKGTSGDTLQLKWAGPTGSLIANESVALASSATIQIVDLGRMNIPEQEPPADISLASFVFSIWRGSVATATIDLDTIELWPSENYVELEPTTGPAENEYAVVDATGRSSVAFLADTSGNRVNTIPHVGSPPVLRVGTSRVLLRMSRSRLDDRRGDLIGADLTYYPRYDLQRGAG